ncbi:MAG TPA: hypothetical protein VJ652_17010 [Noviherbaspirillum sp.]|nr:hypothetical protein [Noviherbaspirillum sp.]
MALAHAGFPIDSDADRVRRSTPDSVNQQIDRLTDSNIDYYRSAGRDQILGRMHELDREWDIERVLEVNASTLALTGLALGATVNRKWLFLTGGVLAFLLQHGLQGWCPPLPLLRRLGVRTRDEIAREKFALQSALEGR